MRTIEASTSSPEFKQLPEKPVPLVANLLQAMRNLGIPEIDIQSAFIDPAFNEFAKSYLLSLAVREAGDQTGILGPLIGVSQSPEETRDILTKIGMDLLTELDKKGEGLKDRVFALLQSQVEGNIDIDVFLTIDDLVKEAVGRIRKVAIDRGLADSSLNNMTPEAHAFWLNNHKALQQLVADQNIESWSLLGLEIIYETSSKGEKIITDINQKPNIPIIDSAPLLEILPDELNRNINKEPPSIDNPLGFLSRLNMAGNPIFRHLIAITRKHLDQKRIAEEITSMP